MSCLSGTRGLALCSLIFCVALVVEPVNAANADDYVAEAREYLSAGDMPAAAIQLKNALKSDPGNVSARLMLGTLHLRNSDGPAAQKELGRARDLGAAREQWMSGYARALVLQGKFDQLLQEIQVSDDLSSSLKAEVFAVRGNSYLALRQTDKAVEEYDAALALDQGNPMARLGKAQILLSQNRTDDAMGELNAVLLAHPGHVETRLVRGDLRRRAQQLEGAETDYQRAADEAPSNARAHIGLALVHLGQRDLTAAKSDLKVLRQIAQNVPAVNYLQAMLSFQEKDFERASDELQVLLRAAPGNLQAQLLYGIVSYARDEFTIADDYLSRVLASVPGNVQVVKLLGAARMKLRQPDRALKVLSTIVDDDTDDAQLLALMGTALIQTGDNSRGAAFVERAVELDPDQALLRTQLAVGKIASGDTGGAIAQLESAVALDQDVVQADVLLVLSYLNKGEFEKAVTASEALEGRMSDSPIPFNLTGLAYLSQRKFEDAEARFKISLKKDPKFVVARMNLARLALIKKRPEAAQAAYREVLKVDPKHVGAMMGLASIAQAANDPDSAVDWLSKANRAKPQALKPVLALAEIYLRKNEGLKAANTLTGLKPEQLSLPAVLRLKGMAQLQSGDYASAVYTLRKLTEAKPDAIEGWFQLARAQAAAEDMAGSRESFERAIALDAKHQVPVVWIGLAELELREKRYAEALVLAEKIKANFPDRVFGHDVEAAAYRGRGETKKSLAAAEAAMKMDKTTTRVNRLVTALSSSGETQKAIDLLRGWLKDNADDGRSWANLGMMYQKSAQNEQSLAAYERALTLGEARPVMLNNMAWLYLDTKGERAVELATQAYEQSPSKAEIVDTYGWVLFKNGRKQEGLAALQQASIIAPRNAEITLHVAEALHDLDRDSEARPMLQRLIRDYPNSEFAESARQLMRRLKG